MEKTLMVWKAAERQGIAGGEVQAETQLYKDGGQAAETDFL